MPLGVFLTRHSAAASSLEGALLHDSKLLEEDIISFFSSYNFRIGRVEVVDIKGERVLFGAVGKGENVLLLGVILENEIEENIFRDLVVDEATTMLQEHKEGARALLVRCYNNMLEKMSNELKKRITSLEEKLAIIGDQRKKTMMLLEARYDEEVKVAEKVRDEEKALDILEQLFKDEKESEKRLEEIMKEKEKVAEEMKLLREVLGRVSSVSAQLQSILAQTVEGTAEVEKAAPSEEKFYTVFDVLKKEYGDENAILLEYLYIIKKPQTHDEIAFHVKWSADALKTRLSQLVKEGYICMLRKKNDPNLFFTVCPSCPLSARCRRERKINWDKVLSLVRADLER
ncbi:MAG: hypothetical protein KIH01_07570 [Candidatus Freyarchaeota archaeon]|nr:hypothetical protein [Candidatus Jordarchaeia archaeon]